MRPTNDYPDINIPTITSDSDTERTSESSSLGQDGQLSQLSRAKMAVALNSIHHVRMFKTYGQEERVTVYALDVFVQSTLTGVVSKSKKLIKGESDSGRIAYQVAYRYSSFRTLRQRIGEVVKEPKDKSHSKWCPYCSRVRGITKSSVFPPRFPSGGAVGIVTGFRDLVAHSREKRLEMFVNLLLRAAKDISYRSGCTPCGRFEAVSRLLNDFLTQTAPSTVPKLAYTFACIPISAFAVS
ncbi:hypothetical protein PHYSODRAFT_486521 [Phytophthora sojae]|uniref:PX domain-containing protein n=1 Tax=Phytophthora sojae (strain P6497) TaxID=1094619 RepID=G4YWZ6_PHYSP|nr:hypothetical protein PHYSODRAFT_486521 [Phytophthora sojae]EGZ24494.1 hypothetical protein PHYSODRAFT_486521 [Phytophthora sojae]|eukprot:XP_009519782.1 hypothetical protein PHYSODRAFT_486521 [Phytophthora sojae]